MANRDVVSPSLKEGEFIQRHLGFGKTYTKYTVRVGWIFRNLDGKEEETHSMKLTFTAGYDYCEKDGGTSETLNNWTSVGQVMGEKFGKMLGDQVSPGDECENFVRTTCKVEEMELINPFLFSDSFVAVSTGTVPQKPGNEAKRGFLKNMFGF